MLWAGYIWRCGNEGNGRSWDFRKREMPFAQESYRQWVGPTQENLWGLKPARSEGEAAPTTGNSQTHQHVPQYWKWNLTVYLSMFWSSPGFLSYSLIHLFLIESVYYIHCNLALWNLFCASQDSQLRVYFEPQKWVWLRFLKKAWLYWEFGWSIFIFWVVSKIPVLC